MSERPPAGRVEVVFRHNAATMRHDYTCADASASLLLVPGRETAGLNLRLRDGRDGCGEPVLSALYAEAVAWVLVRPPVDPVE